MNLTRFQAAPDSPTLGFWQFPDGWGCYTLELPWRANERRREDDPLSGSCIPQGEYRLVYRESPLITRITRGEFTGGYEVTPVEGRTFIMVHHGNWMRNTDGCILVGGEPTRIYDKSRGVTELGVPSSLPTFREFMRRMQGHDGARLVIDWRLDEEPRHA